MRKHIRQIIQSARAENRGADISILRQRGHVVIRVQNASGSGFNYPLSSSPKVTDHAIENSLKDIRRRWSAMNGGASMMNGGASMMNGGAFA